MCIIYQGLITFIDWRKMQIFQDKISNIILQLTVILFVCSLIVRQDVYVCMVKLEKNVVITGSQYSFPSIIISCAGNYIYSGPQRSLFANSSNFRVSTHSQDWFGDNKCCTHTFRASLSFGWF